MSSLNKNGANLVKEIVLANNYLKKNSSNKSKSTKSSSALALAYEKARNAVEYRDEHLIRQAAIERILKRRLFLNQPSEKIANLLIKELNWARYIDSDASNLVNKEKFKNIIEKYRDFEELVGLCACEIDETINFNPINQIIINFTSETLNTLIDFDEDDPALKNIQIYIATERSFAKNSEVLIKYKLLKVLLPNWNDKVKLQATLTKINGYLNYKNKDMIRRKVSQLSPPFNIIRDLAITEAENLDLLARDPEELKREIKQLLEIKYKETKNKVIRASQRSIIYIFLTKMVLAMIIEIPFDIILGNINYLVLSINILFPPSLMILFNSRVRLPDSSNTEMMSEKVNEYLYSDLSRSRREIITSESEGGTANKIFSYIFLITSTLVILGIIYLLNLLSFNIVNQIIFLFFLSVVSFFAFRVRDISNDYLLEDSDNETFFNSLLDYVFLPIIKTGQWLSTQISKINILSFIFDFIIEAPLKTFLEILEQWLHFVRVKKEEFLG
jgi:hypothetical protein